MVATRVDSTTDNFTIQMVDLRPNEPEKCIETFEEILAPNLPSIKIMNGEFGT